MVGAWGKMSMALPMVYSGQKEADDEAEHAPYPDHPLR
jgi:hypothetical protein